jgi:hypothetical protein
MIKRIAAISVLAATLLSGNDSPFAIWLSSSVVTSDKIKTNEEFTMSTGENNSKLRDAFMASFKKEFPYASESLDRKKQKQTFAVFLNISRASNYSVQATDSNIVLYSLPVTASITFMNLQTGEVLYTEVFTHVGNLETTTDDPAVKEKITKEYENTYKGLIEDLAQKASKSFVPKKLEAKIIGQKYGLYILDKGLSEGIREGDSLDGEKGSMFKVKYSSAHYSVAKLEFGENTAEGSMVSRTYNQSLSDLKKPKVSLLEVDYNREKLQITPDMFYQFFVDKLAQKGSFSLMSINKSSYKALNALQDSANLGIRFPKRKPPEYFMRLWADGPYTYDLPTNVDYAVKRNYSITLCGQIQDTSARVLASSCKVEKIEDKVSFGKSYSKEAQFEVLAKNAALSLAEEFAQTVSFQPISYKVVSVEGDTITINDEQNLLNAGTSLTIYRNIGKIGNIPDVNIPIAEVSITDKNGLNAKAQLIMQAFNGAPNIESGDMIFEEIPKSSNDKSKLFTLCDMPSNLGGEPVNGFELVAKFVIPKQLKYPFYNLQGLQESVNKRIEDTEFEQVPTIHAPNTGYCIQPVYKNALVSTTNAESKGYLENKYNMIIGTKEYFGNDLKSKFALGGEKTFYPPSIESKVFIDANMIEYSIGTLENVTNKLEIK